MTAHFDRKYFLRAFLDQHLLKILISSIIKKFLRPFLIVSTSPPLIHHCKSNLSSLHIFVNHCTFCASLHVKTCPDPRWQDASLQFTSLPPFQFKYKEPFALLTVKYGHFNRPRHHKSE